MIIIDIETCADVDISNPEYIKRAKVKWVGIYSFDEDKYYLLSFTDHELAKKLIKEQGNIIITFNGENFDIPILQNRGYLSHRFTSVDIRQVARKHNGVIGKKIYTFSLKNMSKQLLKQDIKGEIDYHIFEKDNWQQSEVEEIKQYLKKDLEATKKLYEYYEEQTAGWRYLLNDYDVKHKKYLTISTASYAYSVLCNLTGMRKEFANDVKHQKYKGGFVAEPAGEKFIGNIYMMDFNSMYPHAYMQGNLFSYNCRCCSENEKWGANEMFPDIKGKYCSKRMGKKEQVIKKLYHDRLKYKANNDPRQYGLKIVLNTMYGVCGNPTFKNLYNRTTASDCTYISRTCVKYARKIFSENGYNVIYSDTDSVYLIDNFNDKERMLKIKTIIIKKIKEYLPFPQETFDMGIDEEPKAIFFIPKGDRYLKKHYIYITKDDKLILKGIKVVKSDTSKLTKLIFKKYLAPLIKQNYEIKYDRMMFRKWAITELENDITLAGKYFSVKKPDFYSVNGQLQKQIALKYGSGRHFLIPNHRYGVGQGTKYCTKEELEEKKISTKDINLTSIYKELEPFMIGKIGSTIIRKRVGRKVILQNTLGLWA